MKSKHTNFEQQNSSVEESYGDFVVNVVNLIHTWSFLDEGFCH
jgi:hypothetical protein